MKTSSKSVAFVAWQALPAAVPHAQGAIGGLETSTWAFCRGLSEFTSWDPILIARSGHRLDAEQIEGVSLRPHVDRWFMLRRAVSEAVTFGFPPRLKRYSARLLWQLPLLLVTRPFRPRDPQPMQPDPRLTRLARPDVWVAMGVGGESAGVIATAQTDGVRSVLMIRSNQDLDPRYREGDDYVSPYGERAEHCRFAIANADCIICQTTTQVRDLATRFDRHGVLLRNPCELEVWSSNQVHAGSPDSRAPGAAGQHVLWIGRYESIAKRIDLAIEVAKRCPQMRFRLVANRSDSELEQVIRRGCPGNVELVDQVAFAQMPAEFAAASALLSTAKAASEGFPNILLQAAASGTPIISLEDFDGFIGQSGAGFVVGNVDAAAQRIQDVVAGHDRIDVESVLDYLRQHHSFETVSRQLGEILDEVESAATTAKSKHANTNSRANPS